MNGPNPRWRIDRSQRGMLEKAFQAKRFPSPETKKRLADSLNVDVRRIQVWFQNRRQRLKPLDEEPSSPTREIFDGMDGGMVAGLDAMPFSAYPGSPGSAEPWERRETGGGWRTLLTRDDMKSRRVGSE